MLCAQSMYCRDYKGQLSGAQFTLIELTIRSNPFPLRFYAASNSDTLKVNTSSILNFVRSIYSSCKDISNDFASDYFAFLIAYGENKMTEELAVAALDFNPYLYSEQCDKYARISEFHLNTENREKVIIRYFEFLGIVVDRGNENITEPKGSPGLMDYFREGETLSAKSIGTPVAVSDCWSKKEELIIWDLLADRKIEAETFSAKDIVE